MDITRSRFEFKYLVDLEIAEKFRSRIEGEFKIDPLCSNSEGYYVNSLYYDTQSLLAYFEKLDGVDPRSKIRLRDYSGFSPLEDYTPETLFLEAKYRENDQVRKDRITLSGDYRERLIAPGYLHPEWGQNVREKEVSAAENIDALIYRRLWYPVVWVNYFRRPYVMEKVHRLRITFDTQLMGKAAAPFLVPVTKDWVEFLPSHLSVVEIKFHEAMPLWLIELTRELGLKHRRYSKYCSALEKIYPKVTLRGVRFEPLLHVSAT